MYNVKHSNTIGGFKLGLVIFKDLLSVPINLWNSRVKNALVCKIHLALCFFFQRLSRCYT